MKTYIFVTISVILTIVLSMLFSSSISKARVETVNLRVSDLESSLRASEDYSRNYVRENISVSTSNMYSRMIDFENKLAAQDKEISAFDSEFTKRFSDKVDTSVADAHRRYQQTMVEVTESMVLRLGKIESEIKDLENRNKALIDEIEKAKISVPQNIVAELNSFDKRLNETRNRLNSATGKTSGIDDRVLKLEANFREFRIFQTNNVMDELTDTAKSNTISIELIKGSLRDIHSKLNTVDSQIKKLQTTNKNDKIKKDIDQLRIIVDTLLNKYELLKSK